VYDTLQLRPFLAQRLGALGIAPDIGQGKLVLDLDQALGLALVVKDTP
jgi:hypothetical protein